MARVLLVDDDELLRDLLALRLEVEGHEIITADDGAAALATLRGMRCDLVVLDIMMPVMDGWQFCTWLAEQPRPLRDTPVVLLSASPRLGKAAAELHVCGQLPKPVSVDRLLGTIEQLCPQRG